VAQNDVGSVTEDTNLSDTGNLLTDNDGAGVDSDIDVGDVLTVASVDGVAAAIGSVAGTHGSLTFADDGSYTYNLTNSDPAVQALGAGETLTETFDYVVSDGNGGSDTATLTITINGQNDAPTGFDTTGPLDFLALCAVYGNQLQVTAGSILGEFGSAEDADANDTHTYRIVDGTGAPITDPNFEIIGNQLVVKASNSLTPGTMSPQTIIVQVDDGSGGTYEQTFNFNVNLYSGSFVGSSDREMVIGTAADDTMNGGGNVDYMFGGAGNDTLNGEGSYDVLEGGAGADILNGGVAGDTASYYYSEAPVTADLANTTLNSGNAAGDVYISIEHLRGSQFGDVLAGDAVFNRIYSHA
jgi:VCBS repeat-containing protein